MNTFDITCLVILEIMGIIGFFQGAVRMLVITIVAYICLILAGLYFQAVGDQIHLAVELSNYESISVAYMGVFLACMITLSSMGIYTFRFLRGNIESPLNRGIGVIASLFTSGVLLGAFAHLVLLQLLPDNAAATRTLIGDPAFIELITTARLAQPLADGANALLTRILAPFVFSDINQLFFMTPTP